MTHPEQTPPPPTPTERRRPSDAEINKSVAEWVGWKQHLTLAGSFWLSPKSLHISPEYMPDFCSPDAPCSLVRQVLEKVWAEPERTRENFVIEFFQIHDVNLYDNMDRVGNVLIAPECIMEPIVKMTPRELMEAALRSCSRWPEEWE